MRGIKWKSKKRVQGADAFLPDNLKTPKNWLNKNTKLLVWIGIFIVISVPLVATVLYFKNKTQSAVIQEETAHQKVVDDYKRFSATNQNDIAIDSIEKFLATNPQELDHKIDAYSKLSSLYISKKDYKKAEEATLKIIELDKSPQSTAYQGLGYIEEQLGDKDKAIQYYKKSLENWDTTEPTSLSRKAYIEAHISDLEKK